MQHPKWNTYFKFENVINTFKFLELKGFTFYDDTIKGFYRYQLYADGRKPTEFCDFVARNIRPPERQRKAQSPASQ